VSANRAIRDGELNSRDETLAGALANLIPKSGEWAAAPSDLLAGIGRGQGFPESTEALVAWIERSLDLLARHRVAVGFMADGAGDLIVLKRVVSGGSAPTLRALDLFCCAGGATRGLQLAGFHVTGVDIAPQPNYCGDAFIQADALEYLRAADLSLFDFIWASPPCQAHTVLKHAPGTKEHVDLIAPTRELLMRSGKPWVIENVEGAPLINPVTLCGTMFGLATPDGVELRRHRLFETSFPLLLTPSCRHGDGGVIGIYGGHFRDRRRETGENHRSGSNLPREHGFIAMGVDWPMTTAEISEAIPPAYSHYAAKQWLSQSVARPAASVRR
jgi:DNA (cytosine-5)-methyltransferase 1